MGGARPVGCGKYKWNPRALGHIGENLSGTLGPAKESLTSLREVFQLWAMADGHPRPFTVQASATRPHV